MIKFKEYRKFRELNKVSLIKYLDNPVYVFGPIYTYTCLDETIIDGYINEKLESDRYYMNLSKILQKKEIEGRFEAKCVRSKNYFITLRDLKEFFKSHKIWKKSSTWVNDNCRPLMNKDKTIIWSS